VVNSPTNATDPSGLAPGYINPDDTDGDGDEDENDNNDLWGGTAGGADGGYVPELRQFPYGIVRPITPLLPPARGVGPQPYLPPASRPLLPPARGIGPQPRFPQNPPNPRDQAGGEIGPRPLPTQPIGGVGPSCPAPWTSPFYGPPRPPGVGGNGAASRLPNLNGAYPIEARDALIRDGFMPKPPTSGNYQNFRHADSSEVWIDWPTGRVVRLAPRQYDSSGRRINKGQRIGPDGTPTNRDIPHEQHPRENLAQ
jgi:hypothetical protein